VSGAAITRTTVWLALAGGLLSLYGTVLAGLWADWLNDPNYAHGIVVVPAVAWLVWNRWADLARLEHRPSWTGALVVAVALAVLLAGHAALQIFLIRISLVGVLTGAVVLLLGWSHLRALWLPVVLLVLAIPLPALIFNEVAFPLQLLASRVGVGVLELGGIPAVREGNVIVLENATLEVAEACSGIRSLISLATLALFFGDLGRQGPTTRTIVAAAVVPISVFANGLRVAGAGGAAHYFGPEAAAGALHDLTGWTAFGLSVALLVVIERSLHVLRRRGGEQLPA